MVRLIVAIILIGMLAAGCDSYGSEEYPQIIIENLTLTSGGSSNSTGSSLWENATDNRYIKPKQDHSLNVTVTDTWPPVAPYVATFEHKGDGKGVSVRTLGGTALELYATTGYGLLINAQDVAFYSIGDVANSPSGFFVNTDTGSAFQAERNVIGTGDDKPIGIFKQREEQNNGSGVAIHNINKTGAVMQWGEPIESYNNAEWLYWMMPRLDNDYYIRMPNDIGQVNECWGINNINGRILNTSWLNCGGGSYTFNVSNNVTTEEVFNGNTVTLAGGNNLTVTQTGTDFIFDWTGILAPTLWTIYSGIDNFLRPFNYGYAVITSWGAVPDGNAWHD